MPELYVILLAGVTFVWHYLLKHARFILQYFIIHEGVKSEGATTLSDQLQVVDVPIISEADCKAVYGPYLTDSMQCAGSEGRDACQVRLWESLWSRGLVGWPSPRSCQFES